MSFFKRLFGHNTHNMTGASSEFVQTDEISHRYNQPGVLKAELKKLGFKNEEIKIKARFTYYCFKFITISS